MSNSHNGHAQEDRQPARRVRIDDFGAIVLRNSPGPAGTTTRDALQAGHSGRRFVVALIIAVLSIWGTLYLVFRDWRAKYRERARYGTTRVVDAIEPLRPLLPPGVDPGAWRDAVDQTRSLLVTVTSSNLLDLNEMDALGGELAQHVRRACARPSTAVEELAGIWNEVGDRGEFLFRDSRSISGERHPRPGILPPRPEKPSRARTSPSAKDVAPGAGR